MRWFFRIFFKAIRALLGPVILLWDALTTPKGIVRSAQAQQRIDADTSRLVLYQFRTCPFCVKVRRAMKRLSLNVETRDALRDMQSRQQLLQGGGQIKVPCLKITGEDGEATWMYESSAIVEYLQHRFAENQTA